MLGFITRLFGRNIWEMPLLKMLLLCTPRVLASTMAWLSLRSIASGLAVTHEVVTEFTNIAVGC